MTCTWYFSSRRQPCPRHLRKDGESCSCVLMGPRLVDRCGSLANCWTQAYDANLGPNRARGTRPERPAEGLSSSPRMGCAGWLSVAAASNCISSHPARRVEGRRNLRVMVCARRVSCASLPPTGGDGREERHRSNPWKGEQRAASTNLGGGRRPATATSVETLAQQVTRHRHVGFSRPSLSVPLPAESQPPTYPSR
jgi:hypothetical protein